MENQGIRGWLNFVISQYSLFSFLSKISFEIELPLRRLRKMQGWKENFLPRQGIAAVSGVRIHLF